MMKKSVVIFVFLLLVLPMLSAVQFEIKDSFDKGETLMAKITGNFLKPILPENIFFYRGHVRIAIDASVSKIDDDYYIYALLEDKEPNNYSIKIEEVKYMQGATASEEDLVKEFTITNNTADFSVKPGFILTEGDFSLEVQNLQDNKIEIEISITTIFGQSSQGFFASLFDSSSSTSIETDSVSLKSGEKEKIDFNVGEITQATLKTIKLNSENLEYEIPVYIFASEEKPKEKSYKFEPAEMEISMSTNLERTKIIYLYNNGEQDLENITLSVSDSLKPYVSFSVDEIDELEANSSIKLELYFSPGYEEQNLEGQIIAKAIPDFFTYSAVFLNIIQDYIPLEGEDIWDEVIDPSTQPDVTPDDEESDSSIGKIIGWLLVAIVVVFLIWFFLKKYRGTKKSKPDLLKISEGK